MRFAMYQFIAVFLMATNFTNTAVALNSNPNSVHKTIAKPLVHPKIRFDVPYKKSVNIDLKYYISGKYDRIKLSGKPKVGATSITKNGMLNYTHDTDVTGEMKVHFVVEGSGGVSNGVVSLMVKDDISPSIRPKTLYVPYNSLVGYSYKDAFDGYYSKVIISQPPTKGEVTITNGVLMYAAKTGATGDDSYEITLIGDQVNSVGIVNVVIDPATDDVQLINSVSSETIILPSAMNLRFHVPFNSDGNHHDLSTYVTGLDGELRLVSEPENGTAYLTGDTIVYSPNGDYHGADKFEYIAVNNDGSSSKASIIVDVDEPVPPVVQNVSLTLPANGSLSIDLSQYVSGYFSAIVLNGAVSNGYAAIDGTTLKYNATPDEVYDSSISFNVLGVGDPVEMLVYVSVQEVKTPFTEETIKDDVVAQNGKF